MNDDQPREQTAARVDQDNPRFSYDWTTYESPSTAIVEVAAEATGEDVLELAPLQHYVDAGMLNGILEDRKGADPTAVTFSYVGLEIEIDSSGRLDLWVHDLE